jgi:hypothetical protein
VSLPAGAQIGGVVLSDQIKSLDRRARKAEFAGRADDAVTREVLLKLATLLDPEESLTQRREGAKKEARSPFIRSFPSRLRAFA